MQKIYPLICALALGFTLLAVPAAPVASYAEGYGVATQPLVIIRFNQPRVYYDKQLYGAISQAVATKPDVMFDVVSHAPTTGNMQVDEQWIRTASHNTQAVVADMQRMGIPLQRMHVTGKAMAGLRFDETHIYVR